MGYWTGLPSVTTRNCTQLSASGFTLVELVVSVLLVGLVATTGLVLTGNLQKTMSLSSRYIRLTEIRSDALRILRDRKVLDRSITAPENSAAFSCLAGGGDCRGVSAEFTVFDVTGKRVPGLASANQPNQGLNLRGDECDQFSPSSYAKDCPFRFQARWSAICEDLTVPCRNPSIQVTANLIIGGTPPPEISNSLNPKNFLISIVHTQERNSAAEVCVASGGAFDATLQRCFLAAHLPCPDFNFLVGFNPDGSKICVPIKPFQCDFGQVLLEIRQDGTYVCGPGCVSGDTTTGDYLGPY